MEEACKALNEPMLRPLAISKPLLNHIFNLVHVSNVIYEGEDGYTIVSQAKKARRAAVTADRVPI